MPPHEKQPRLQRIAKRANVSIATVSRVLNNRPNVSPENRRKVLGAYRQIYNATPPSQQPSIGLIVPDASNPFYADLTFAFERALEKHDIHLLASNSEGRVERELALAQRFKGLGVKGLIFISSSSSSEALLPFIADGDPVLVLDRRVGSGNLDFVAVNSQRGTRTAVDYLVQYGHRRIGYLRGLEGTASAKERFQSFREAMARNGLTLAPDHILQGEWDPESGARAAEQLLKLDAASRPTAILAGNDLMAIGLMHRLQRAGWELPKQLSVIGFDDIKWSAWVTPALTTIAQPVNDLVYESVRLLMRRIEGARDPQAAQPEPAVVEVEPALISRASVTAAPVTASDEE